MLKTFEATGKSIEEAIDAAMAMAGDVSSFDVDVEVLENGSKGFLGIGSKPAKVKISFDDGKKDPASKAKKEFRPKEIKPIEFHVEDAKPIPRREPKIRVAQPVQNRNNHKDAFRAESVKPDTVRAEKAQAVCTMAEIKPEADITDYEKESAKAALDFLSGIFEKMEIAPTAETVFITETINISFSGKNLGSLIGRRGETLNALQYLTNLVVNHRDKSEHVRIVLDVEGYRKEREATLVSLALRMADKCAKIGNKVELDPMNPHERRIVHIALENDDRVETVSYGSEPFRKVVIISKNKKVRK